MRDIQRRLDELLKQKLLIEEEITQLQEILNHEKTTYTKNEKIELFKSFFIGRTDRYAKKWVSKDLTQERFFPVTQTYKGEDYLPLSNEAIEGHLRGQEQLATYPILDSSLCSFLVLKIIQEDAYKIQMSLNKYKLHGYFEITSSNDYKVWLFFSSLIEAKWAKALGELILHHVHVQGEIFPNQEFANASNLGSYIELPLFLKHRQNNQTVFVDIVHNQPILNQWHYIHTMVKNPKTLVEELTQKTTLLPASLKHEVVLFPNFPLNIILYDAIYIPTLNLSKSLLNLLKSYACFDNPQVKLLLSLRKPLYNIPKIIKSFEEEEGFLKLPRGLLQKIKTLFDTHNVTYTFEDRRVYIKQHFPAILFTLRDEQKEAINNISPYSSCICVAPPGFGKTLIGAKMVELHQCNTLVIVNKNMLLNQWIERFSQYFALPKKSIGYLGKGHNNLKGILDIATMQSLKNSPEIIHNYSFVIVDECHHIPAVTFEQIIKAFKGKFVLGLSATPNRKDGLEPILYQQLGQVAYEFKAKKSFSNRVKIVYTHFESQADNYATLINEVCVNEKRNHQILQEIKTHKNRTVLVLTDRLEHISELEKLLDKENYAYLSVHGNLNKKEQKSNMELVETSQLILATTSFFGEGIDFPHLNTIIFATPISYYGRLIQYLGRIGRNGQDCLAIDFLDSKNAMLYSAFKKRQEGYKQMHYRVMEQDKC